MERARWNTELSHKKLNFVICPTFWGSLQNNDAACLYFYMTSNDQDCFSTPPELSSFSKRRSNFTEANDEL